MTGVPESPALPMHASQTIPRAANEAHIQYGLLQCGSTLQQQIVGGVHALAEVPEPPGRRVLHRDTRHNEHLVGNSVHQPPRGSDDARL